MNPITHHLFLFALIFPSFNLVLLIFNFVFHLKFYHLNDHILVIHVNICFYLILLRNDISIDIVICEFTYYFSLGRSFHSLAISLVISEN